MSLSYHYEFAAPAEVAASQLEVFLREMEETAKSLGFAPTVVLNIPFDTDERREFARRLSSGFTIQDDCLRGVVIPDRRQVYRHDPIHGECRVIPEHGVILVITDEQSCEVTFGFLRFPTRILDVHGRKLVETGLEAGWTFRNFVTSSDPRYRTLVKSFQKAGYTTRLKDDFA